MALKPFCWHDKPALIEKLFPVQKLSVESHREQEDRWRKTLTTLGSYWKGRKPLILNKSCILASLLPTTGNDIQDLKIFELLMSMDNQSITERFKANFAISKHGKIPKLLKQPFYKQVEKAKRSEMLDEISFNHIWDAVNQHLGTSASSMTELVEQMGIARFGRRPKLADTFAGSGQIPFEAARLGCDVFASDLNPIACMLSWANFNIVGTDTTTKAKIAQAQQQVVAQVQAEITKLGIETDGRGWQTKSYLYCLEARCPASGWLVPMIPNFIINKSASKNKDSVCVKLVADAKHKKYKIELISNVKTEDLEKYKQGTVQQGELVHAPDGKTIYRSKISSIRLDYKAKDGSNKNKLRPWAKTDFTPAKDDIFQERLYCIQWIKQNAAGKKISSEFRAVTNADLTREQQVIDYVASHLKNWQAAGLIPDMRIEHGDKTDEPIRTRGWHYWHQLFNPRQLLQFALLHKYSAKSDYYAYLAVFLARALNWNSKLCVWNNIGVKNEQVFYNQALNTINNYGCRSFYFLQDAFNIETKSYPLNTNLQLQVVNQQAQTINQQQDLYITDPPYGDAVKYEEITEFFIAWLCKNSPQEFADWVWDSRRRLAIKGKDDAFRQAMIASYTAMTEQMVANGIQVLMFTHKSGNIWASLANILWASGLRVTASWYIVTETDSGLRQGANIKGTVILVLRKRAEMAKGFRDELGWEIQDAVKAQIDSMIGLDKQVRLENPEGLYTDADLQMAGYAAALSVLTAYSHIDGKDMAQLAQMPETTGKKSMVTELIEFAVQTAVRFLVPLGFKASEWQKLTATERFYLKMLEMECEGTNKLDDYQNFAKAFKVNDYSKLMSADSKANKAKLKLATEFKKTQMKTGDEFAGSLTRAVLYAMYEINNKVEITDVLAHLAANYQRYIENNAMLVKVANYIYQKRKDLTATKSFPCDKDAEAAHILAEALANQRL